VQRNQKTALYLRGFAGTAAIPLAFYEGRSPLTLVDVVSVEIDDIGQGIASIHYDHDASAFYIVVADPEGAMSSRFVSVPSDPAIEPWLASLALRCISYPSLDESGESSRPA